MPPGSTGAPSPAHPPPALPSPPPPAAAGPRAGPGAAAARRGAARPPCPPAPPPPAARPLRPPARPPPCSRPRPPRPRRPLPLEQYALIGDRHTAALVGSDGTIDWLCLPRFDSPACFASLLGTPDNGQWALAPAGRSAPVGRRYRQDSLVLETDLVGDTGR